MPEREWILNALNAGELSPRVHSRGDQTFYASGTKQLLNMIPLIAGGADRRPGTRFAQEVHDSSLKHRLIEFQFSTTQSFILELGPKTMRFYQDGGIVLQSEAIIQSPTDVDTLPNTLRSKQLLVRDQDGPWQFTATTGALPTPLLLNTDYFLRRIPTHTTATVDTGFNLWTLVGHEFLNQMGPMNIVATRDDLDLDLLESYFIRGITATTWQVSKTLDKPLDITNLDGTGPGGGVYTFKPTPETERTVFQIALTPDGVAIDLADNGTGTHTFTRVTEVPIVLATPYKEDELAEIRYAQSGDILYLVHQNHPPHRLLRFSDTSWHLEEVKNVDGPYETENLTTTEVGIDKDGPDAGVELDATEDIFQGWHVGQPFRWSDDGVRQGWGRITEVNAVEWDNSFIVKPTFVSTDVDIGTDIIGLAAPHPFETGDPTRFTLIVGGLPAPLRADITYYVIDVNSSTIKLATSLENALAGTAIDLTTVGETMVTHTLVSALLDFGAATAFVDGDGPYFTTAHHRLPLGLSVGQSYWLQGIETGAFPGFNDHIKFLDGPQGDVVGFLDLGTAGQYDIHGGPNGSSVAFMEAFEDLFDSVQLSEIWRIGAWGGSPGPGFPRAVGFSEQRLWYGGTPGAPNTIWSSRSADFQGFGPDDPGLPDPIEVGGIPSDHSITDQSSISAFLVSGEINIIHWLAELRVLIGGTAGGLWRIQSSTLLEPATPTNINPHMSASTSSAAIQPIKANEVLVYVCESRCRLLAATFSAEKDTFVPRDLNILADHLPLPGIDDIAWSPIPWQVIWCARTDGRLISCNFNDEQDVTAWAQHKVGGSWVGDVSAGLPATDFGAIESVASISSGDHLPRRYSQTWMIVKRTINGVTRRYVEWMTPRFEVNEDLDNAAFVDSHLVPYDGVAKTLFTGLDHLEGETVAVWADGSDQPDQVVTGGEVTIDTAASKVVIGLRQNTRIETLPLKFAIDRLGSARSRIGRHIETSIALFQTSGLLIGPDEASLAQIPFRSVDDPMDAPPPLFTGVIHIDPHDHWDREGILLFGQNTAGPLTFLGLDSLVSWEGR